MIKIVSPKDIVWAEISVNTIVKEIINSINNLLMKNNAFSSNEFSYTIEMENSLDQRSVSLLKFAFSEYGWNILSKKQIIDNSVKYTFKLIVSNPIYL